MKITLDWLREKSACEDGIAWFEGNFGNEADCQKVLDELGKLDKVDWARWLINKAGPTTSVLEIQGNVEIEHSLFFLGTIRVGGKITCENIEVGRGIKAGEGIEAGEDSGIYAGLMVRLSLKTKYATVKARTRPKNLILGTFEELKQ